MIERTSSNPHPHAVASQLLVNPAIAVGLVAVVEHRPHRQAQRVSALRRRRRRTAPPFIEPRLRHSRPQAHPRDRIVGLLAVDELVLRAHWDSRAKKAAAFPRNSFFILSSRFSASN